MSDRSKLAKLFEIAGQTYLEISRIMAKQAEAESALSKKEYAMKMKQERLETQSERVLQDLSKPHPDPKPEVLRMIREAKDKM